MGNCLAQKFMTSGLLNQTNQNESNVFQLVLLFPIIQERFNLFILLNSEYGTVLSVLRELEYI
jgi:hypothetical protein